MGAGFLNYDPSAGEAPPQAPAPVETLADLAVTPAPSSTDVLRTSAFGDVGAAQYNRLASAGQRQASPGLAGLAGMSPAASPAQPTSAGVQPSDFMQLFGDIAAGAAGHPEAGQERALAQARMQQQQQSMELQKQQAMQSQATSDFSFLKDLKNMAPQYRPGLITNYFARQGRQVPPEMAAMIGDEQILSRLTDPETEARLAHDSAFKQMFWYAMDKPEAFVKFNTGIMQDKAQTDKYIADAEKARTDANAEPGKIAQDQQKRALEIAAQIRQNRKPPSLDDLRMLDSAGLAAWPVPMAGAPGETAFMTGPKDKVPPGVTPLNPRDVEAQQQEAKAPLMTIQRAREQVASAKDTSKALLTMLNDPKYDAAKKSLGPDLTMNVAGYQVGPSQFNKVWRNYKDYGGQGNTPEQNKLMEGIGYYTGTGFQAFLAGLRNQKIVEDIRVHIPQPFDKEDLIRSKIEYLNGRYDSVLKEFAAGAGSIRSLRKEAGVPVAGSPETSAGGTPAPGGRISAEDYLNP